jgi:hypothetical protein
MSFVENDSAILSRNIPHIPYVYTYLSLKFLILIKPLTYTQNSSVETICVSTSNICNKPEIIIKF